MADAPDSYQYNKTVQRGILSDMAELAARLGSPNTFTRTGVTLFQDSFVNGVSSWIDVSYKTGSYVNLEIDNGEVGGVSAHLHAVDSADAYASIARFFAVPELKKIGIEVAIDFPYYFDFLWLGFAIGLPTGEYEGSVRYYLGDQSFKYEQYSDTYISFGTVNLDADGNPRFDRMKLIIDLESLEYHSFRYNQNLYSLANIPLLQLSSNAANRMSIKVLGSSDGGGEADFYVDWIILTTDEI